MGTFRLPYPLLKVKEVLPLRKAVPIVHWTFDKLYVLILLTASALPLT